MVADASTHDRDEGWDHRRRIDLEDMAKVVTSYWGIESLFLATVAVLPGSF